MNLKVSVLSFFSGLMTSAKKFFSSKDFTKAEQIARAVGDILQYALPAVQLVAAMTPNKTDDQIVALIQKLSIPTTVDFTKPLQPADKTGLLMAAASYVLKGNLAAAIASAAGVGIEIGGEKLKTVSDISDNWLNTAVNACYTTVKTVTSVQG